VHALFHLQSPPHTCVPPDPQARVSSGLHMPSSLHVDQSESCPVFVSQVRVCTPQLPHARERSPSHVCPAQTESHWQSPPQVCVPFEPQARVSSGLHSPSSLHACQSDQAPVSPSQLRICVPQLPHARAGGPWHA
jgi:energy-converting hydrogenase Eha subunit F